MATIACLFEIRCPDPDVTVPCWATRWCQVFDLLILTSYYFG